MGTRAQAFIGSPHDYENRRYLGSVGFDGYVFPEMLSKARSAEEFEKIWFDEVIGRRDFCPPDRPYPFPWADDIFVSDITLAWFAPEGQPEGPYRDASLYGSECDARPDVPLWPDKAGFKKKAVWLSCVEEAKHDAAYQRATKRIEKKIQEKINLIPIVFEHAWQYHESDEFQAAAKAVRETFDDELDKIEKKYEKKLDAIKMKSAGIPGPAIAHSSYVRQPDADSIIIISA
jgi:hypothetical protein